MLTEPLRERQIETTNTRLTLTLLTSKSAKQASDPPHAPYDRPLACGIQEGNGLYPKP
jgi:hypothetical protein